MNIEHPLTLTFDKNEHKDLLCAKLNIKTTTNHTKIDYLDFFIKLYTNTGESLKKEEREFFFDLFFLHLEKTPNLLYNYLKHCKKLPNSLNFLQRLCSFIYQNRKIFKDNFIFLFEWII